MSRVVPGHRGLTASVLASVLCLLAAGLAVYLKRKTLVRLLFTDKKTLEKLRYGGGGGGSPQTAIRGVPAALSREQTVGVSHVSASPLPPPRALHTLRAQEREAGGGESRRGVSTWPWPLPKARGSRCAHRVFRPHAETPFIPRVPQGHGAASPDCGNWFTRLGGGSGRGNEYLRFNLVRVWMMFPWRVYPRGL